MTDWRTDAWAAYNDMPELPEQLALPDLTFPELPRAATIGERFRAFHEANPVVFQELRRMALDLAAKGHKRISVKMLAENLRYSAMRTRSTDGWKINNTIVSRYARLLSDSVPELAGLIELRQLKSA